MGNTYTRQSSFTDGDVITADLFNNEYDQLLAAFAASTGHTHDGTAAEGGPITKLLGTSITIGDATSGTDITVTFDGESNDGVFKWMEDEDYFEYSDDILIASTEKLQFRDTAIYINSSADGQLDLVADTEIQIAATTIDINGAADISGNLAVGGNLTVTGTTTFNGGTLTLGDSSADNVVFGADVDSSIIPDDDDTYDLGSASQQWRNIFIDGTAEIDTLAINGTTVTSTAAELNILDGVTSTAAEINIVDGDTSATATTVADADRVVLNDNGTMVQVAVTDLAAYFDDEITAMPNLVTTAATTVGALNSGSITSGFGTIDTGSSTITTTGLISGGSLGIDNVVINGSTIGHTDDTDLITVASGIATVAGELSVTTLDIGGTNVTSTATELNLLDGVSGLVQADFTKLAAVDSTAAELNIVDGGTSATSTTVVDADRVVMNDNGTMVQVAVTDLAAYFDDEITAMPNLVTTAATTVGALNSGSITSGFGTIDTGSSNITTTGVGAFGSLDISGDIDVDGTTNLDVVDIDGAVDFASTTAHAGNASFADDAKAIFGAGSDLQIYHDGSASRIHDNGTGNLILSATDFQMNNGANNETMFTATSGGAVTLKHSGNSKLATTSGGITVTGEMAATTMDLSSNAVIDGTALVTGVLTTTAATVFNGGFAANDGSTISTADNTTQLTLASTDADGSVGPVLDLYRNSSSPAANDRIGSITFTGENAAGEIIEYVSIDSFIRDTTDGSEDGQMNFQSMVAGANASRMQFLETETSFNEDSKDLNFRVESNAHPAALYVDGGTDGVGINSSAPISFANGQTVLFVEDTTNPSIAISDTGQSKDYYIYANGAQLGIAYADGSNTGAVTNSTEIMNMSNGADGVSFNEGGIDRDFRVESDGNANMLFVDGGNNVFGIGTNAPTGFVGIRTPAVNYSSGVFDKPHLALQAEGDPDDNDGFVGITYATSSSDNFGWSAGAERTSGGVGEFVLTYHSNSATGTERLRIDTSGNLLVGNSGAFTSGGDNSGGSGAVMIARDNERCLFLKRAGSNGTIADFIRGGITNPVGSISITTSATAYNTSSDHRLKENVVYDWDATTRLKQLKPARFNFIADADTTVDGFLAHEAQAVVPEAVTGTKDEVDDDGVAVMQGIDQSKIVPLLVKTILELEARITALEG